MINLDQRIEEVEGKSKDIKARWPFHTPKVSMVQELEEGKYFDLKSSSLQPLGNLLSEVI